MQYGGLWRTETELLENKRNIDERKWKEALITQTKYWKVVLETCVKDKKLLQLTSNRKELSTQQLEDNLLCVIKGMEKEEPIIENVSIYRVSDVRWELNEEYVAKKRKAASTASTSATKQMQLDLPNLVNKFILQKWIKDGKEQWFRGKVLKALGNTNDPESNFEVQYVDEQGVINVKLYEDFLNNDLVIM